MARRSSVAKRMSGETAGPLLSVRGLRVVFRTNEGIIEPVRGVSFDLNKGQRLGLVGESGSGKSVTALAIMGLIRPPGMVSDGEVRLRDTNLLELRPRAMAGLRGGEIAMVYQDPMSALNPAFTVGRQISEAIRLHEDVSKEEAHSRAIDLLFEVGISAAKDRYRSYPHEFSGGMRQRAVIAMAIAASPSVLIADEPTTALDVTTQARIMALLSRLSSERSMSVILITHDLGVAAGFCDDVDVMYAGRIVEQARTLDIYSSPLHPYAEALLKSLCTMDTDPRTAIPSIPGQPPLPQLLPSGCTFHPRCPYAHELAAANTASAGAAAPQTVPEVCSSVAPEPVAIGSGSRAMVECHFATDRAEITGHGARG